MNNKLYQVLRMCRHRTSQIPFRVEPALHDHYAIVDAINNRDPELAEILMRRHISGAWKVVEKLLNQEENKESK